MEAERGVHDIVPRQFLKVVRELGQFPLGSRAAQGFRERVQGGGVAGTDVMEARGQAEPDRREAAVLCHGLIADHTWPDFLMAEGASSRTPRVPSTAVEPCSTASLSGP